MNAPCPCQSSKSYADCCQPLHLAQSYASNAEQLMRSRYSAYYLHLIDYVIKTTLPAQQAELPEAELRAWAENTHWLGLEVIQHRPAITNIHSLVEFKAYYASPEGKAEHHESSLFVHSQGRWYFVDPTTARPSNKQPCFCGSGKKFKHCCGGWL